MASLDERGNGRHERLEQRPHHCPAFVETGIQVNRRDQRLERIGENGFAPKTAALEFARAELELVAQLKLARDRRQRLPVDQLRAQARKLTLAGIRVSLVKQLGHDHAKQRVAEEFHPLVVRLAHAAMGQRQLTERRITKAVCELVKS